MFTEKKASIKRRMQLDISVLEDCVVRYQVLAQTTIYIVEQAMTFVIASFDNNIDTIRTSSSWQAPSARCRFSNKSTLENLLSTTVERIRTSQRRGVGNCNRKVLLNLHFECKTF